ncbi:MAG: hypothetical protein ACPG4Z_07860 [Chitinophagales bacterium]
MKGAKIAVALVLWIGVAGLAFWLYKIIQEPVVYQAGFDVQETATVDRMKDIREAQNYYIEVHGTYSNNWDSLINTIKYDEIMEIKTIGNPDDTLEVTTYDTIMRPINELVAFNGTDNVDSLKYIPYSKGEIFKLEANVIKVQRVNIPVYQVIAYKENYLMDLNPDFVRLEKDLIMGSLTEASDAGNWE